MNKSYQQYIRQTRNREFSASKQKNNPFTQFQTANQPTSSKSNVEILEGHFSVTSEGGNPQPRKYI
jgi:hypothetical protein